MTRVYKLSNGQTIVSYTYNDKGLKHNKTTYISGTAVKDIYYSYDAGGAQVASYTRDLLVPAPSTVLQDQTLYAAGRVGLLDASTGKTLFELSDHLGNVRAVVTASVNGAAETVSYTDYFPSGLVLPGRNYTSSITFPYGYQGQEKDQATGLTNFELRQYDPRIGRWYNPDPMGQHHSPYLAMSNNPVSFTDPDGGWDDPDGGDKLVGKGMYDRFQAGRRSENGSNWIDEMEYKANRGADIHRRNELRGKYSGVGQFVKRYTYSDGSSHEEFNGFYGDLGNGKKEAISAKDVELYFNKPSNHQLVRNIEKAQEPKSHSLHKFFSKEYVSDPKKSISENKRLQDEHYLRMNGAKNLIEIEPEIVPGIIFPFPVTRHFAIRLIQRGSRGVTPEGIMRAYNRGRLYYNPKTKNYIRFDPKSKISVVVDKMRDGKAVTVFEGKPSPDWLPVNWRSN